MNSLIRKEVIHIFRKIRVPTQDTSTNVEDVKRSFIFDYNTNTFKVTDGIVQETDRVQATKQWIELFIRTEKDKYKIYSTNFGTDLSDLVGYRLPRGYQVSEIMRRVNDGILNGCKSVQAVRNWKFNKDGFYFTVILTDGTEVTIGE